MAPGRLRRVGSGDLCRVRRVHDLSVLADPHLSLAAKVRQLRQVIQAGQMEGPEKLFGGPVQAGPSGYLQAAALLDELPVQQQADGIGAVHTPDLIHIGPGGGLVVRR